MTGNWSVKVEGLSKKFSISLKDSLRYGLMDSTRRMLGLKRHGEILRPGEFWALKDVSFTLNPGEALGIMGVNGSGKTTLLRVLNGTYAPDTGVVQLRGRIGSLIAVGAGFSPMMSGRENVYVSGSLLGMTQAEIRAKFDEIVAFSELESFIDMPVRNYSSGMAIRLGFAVAALGDPDVLLVDEVLAVGDMAFSKKCYERIFRMRENGTTILVVSHSIGAVWSICNSGLFLDGGNSSGKIGVEDVCRAYDQKTYFISYKNTETLNENDTETINENNTEIVDENDIKTLSKNYGGKAGGTGDAIITKVEVCSLQTGEEKKEFEFKESLLLKMYVTIYSEIVDVLFRYTFDAIHYKYIAVIDSYEANTQLEAIKPGEYIVMTAIPENNLRPGTYVINTNVCQKNVGIHLYYAFNSAKFIVKPPADRFLYADPNAIIHLESSFTIEKAG